MSVPTQNKIIPNQSAQLLAEDHDMFATFSNVDFQRTRFWCLTAIIAISQPRRIGYDATGEELILDKSISRKMGHGYLTLWDLFHKNMQVPPAPEWTDNNILNRDPIMMRIGATVMWPQQVLYLMGVVERRMEKLSGYQQLAEVDQMKRWYNKQRMLLDWELGHLRRMNKFIESS